jgi:hypothetical protein
MSTFEGGWICQSCWKSNRESDLVCYRCKALQPGYRLVPDEPRRREPRQPRTSVVRPIARRGAAVSLDSAASAARFVTRLGRRSLAAGRAVLLIPVNVVNAALSAVARVSRAAGQFVAATVRGAGRGGRRLAGAAVGSVRASAALIGHGVAWPARRGATAISAAARGLGAGVNGVAASLATIAHRVTPGQHQGHQRR